MNQKFRTRVFVAAILCLSFLSMPSGSFSAEADFSLGLGVAFVPDYEGSDDSEGFPVPFASAKWPNNRFVKLKGNTLRANVISSATWQLGPVLQFRKTRDDDVDNTAVSRLRKIDAAVEAGVFFGFESRDWDAGLQIANDITGNHDGMLATVTGGYTWHWNSLTTRIGIFITFANNDYMETYFSVDADNSVRSGLPVFNADAGIKDAGIDATLRYCMTGSWDLLGLLGFSKLANDASDSPLVDIEGDENQMSAAVVAIYNF